MNHVPDDASSAECTTLQCFEIPTSETRRNRHSQPLEMAGRPASERLLSVPRHWGTHVKAQRGSDEQKPRKQLLPRAEQLDPRGRCRRGKLVAVSTCWLAPPFPGARPGERGGAHSQTRTQCLQHSAWSWTLETARSTSPAGGGDTSRQ